MASTISASLLTSRLSCARRSTTTALPAPWSIREAQRSAHGSLQSPVWLPRRGAASSRLIAMAQGKLRSQFLCKVYDFMPALYLALCMHRAKQDPTRVVAPSRTPSPQVQGCVLVAFVWLLIILLSPALLLVLFREDADMQRMHSYLLLTSTYRSAV